jgi:hypothetical protein
MIYVKDTKLILVPIVIYVTFENMSSGANNFTVLSVWFLYKDSLSQKLFPYKGSLS